MADGDKLQHSLATMPKTDYAEAIPRELADRLHRELKKRGVIYELLPNGTRVSLPTRQKPPAVIIGQTGFELLPKGLRFFRAKGDRRLALPRGLGKFPEAFERVCRHYRVIRPKRHAAPKVTAKSQAVERAGTALLDVLLTGVASRRAASVRRAVSLAVTNPEAYVDRYAEQLDERGITAPQPDLHHIALVDALLDAGRLGEIDWRADPGELRDELKPLLRPYGIKLQQIWPTAVDTGADQLLREISQRLAALRHRLLIVDLHNDSYDFVIVPAASVRGLTAAAKRFGLGFRAA